MRNINIPCLPVVVSYEESKITIGAWSITRQPPEIFFHFFVKPETLTWEALTVLQSVSVYITNDFLQFARRKPKKDIPVIGFNWFRGTVSKIDEIGSFKLFSVRINQDSYRKPPYIYFNYGTHTETIGSAERRSGLVSNTAQSSR